MPENNQNLKPVIEKLIEEKNWSQLRKTVMDLPPPEIADLLISLDRPNRAILFRLLPRKLSIEVFAHLEPEQENNLLKDLTDEETRQILARLKPDDRTNLLEELPGQATQRLLNLLSPEDLKEARLLLGYPEGSVGRLMTPDYVAVRADWKISRALEHIRKKGKDSETINVIYVVDASWKLLDALELRRFILANPEDTVDKIMDYSFISITAFEDREEAVRTIQRYHLEALPVINTEGVLLGIVTIDDVLGVAQEEATEDFHKYAAVAPLKISYRDSSIWSLFSKRISWLVFLVFLNLASSGVIAAYEKTLATAVVLAFFIPLLIDSGGNTGAQSSTLMVRALATGDVEMSQWARTLLKELAVGITLGVVMGLAASFLGVFRGGVEIGIIVGLTMIFIVLISNLIGVTLPFLLTRVGLDPAVASSPLITSLADVTGLIIYFTIATIILS